MSFVKQALSDLPVGLWKLDNPIQYQDYSGYNRSGLMAGTEVFHPSLVNDALYSVIFNKNNKANFNCPIFLQGKEKDPFSLETWVRPYYKTEGYNARPYRENLNPNPSFEQPDSYFTAGSSGIATGALDTTRELIGTQAITWTRLATSPSATLVNAAYYSHITYSNAYSVKATEGKYYSSGAWIFTSVATEARLETNWRVNPNVSISTDLGTYISVPANTWTWVAFEGIVAPATTTHVALRVTTRLPGGTGTTSGGETVTIDGSVFNEGLTVYQYFDGDVPGYEWAGTPNASISRTMKSVSKVNRHIDPTLEGQAGLTGSTVNGGTVSNSAYPTTFDTTTFLSGANSRHAVRTATVPSNLIGNFYWGAASGAFINKVSPGEIISVGAWIRSSVSGRANISVTFRDASNAAIGSAVVSPYFLFSANTWTFVKLENIVAPPTTYFVSGDSEIRLTGGSNTVGGEESWIDSVILTSGPTVDDFFYGNSFGAGWAGTVNASASYIYTSNGEQQILGNTGYYDGLVIDGSTVSFVTKYLTTGEARASYDIGDLRNMHIVGVHTRTKNSLYIDSELVAEVDITDAQQADSYISTATNLTAGETLTAQFMALNNVAIYADALSEEEIFSHFEVGRRPDNPMVAFYGGENAYVSKENADVMFTNTWNSKEAWLMSELENVTIDDDALVPQFNGTVSLAGRWRDSIDLYNFTGASPIYGVIFDWIGEGINVNVSLDGITWMPVVRNRNVSIIPDGFTPSNQELFVEVSFPGGIVNDDSYLEYLNVTAFKSKTIPINMTDTIVVSGTAHIMNEYPAIEMRDDWGIRLPQSTGLISSVYKTIEVWYRPLDNLSDNTLVDTRVVGTTSTPWFRAGLATGTNGGTGFTKYLNGNTMGSSVPTIGTWNVIHLVSASDIVKPTTINGVYNGGSNANIQIGKIVTYANALTATQISEIVKSYSGVPTFSTLDTSAIATSEGATPATLFAFDWAVLTSTQ